MADGQQGFDGLATGINSSSLSINPSDISPSPPKTTRIQTTDPKTGETVTRTTTTTTVTVVETSESANRKTPRKARNVCARKKLKGLKHKMSRQIADLINRELETLVDAFLKEAETDPDRVEASVMRAALPKIEGFANLIQQYFAVDSSEDVDFNHINLGSLQKMYLAAKAELNIVKADRDRLQNILANKSNQDENFSGAATQQDRVEEIQLPVSPQQIRERDTPDGTEGISIEVPDYSLTLPGLHDKIQVPTSSWEQVKVVESNVRSSSVSNVVTPEAVLPELLHLNWVSKPSRFDWTLSAQGGLYSAHTTPGEHIELPTSRRDDRTFKLAVFGDSCLNRQIPFLKKHPHDHLTSRNHIFEAVNGASVGQTAGYRNTKWKSLESFIKKGPHDNKGFPVRGFWDIDSFTDHIWWVGRNDLSDKPRNGRVTKKGQWLAHKFYELVQDLARWNPNVRVYIVSPTPSPDDVDKYELENFLHTIDDLLEGEKDKRKPITSNMSVIEYGYGQESDKIKWEPDQIHPRKNDIYTNTFFWELVNAVSSFGAEEKLGRRPFTNDDNPWEGWSKFWHIDDKGRNSKKVYSK